MSLDKHIQSLVRSALEEDGCKKDVTTVLAIPSKLKATGIIVAQDKGVLSGIDLAETVFKQLNKKIKFKALKKDGSVLKKGIELP